jgi:hypothetical protein
MVEYVFPVSSGWSLVILAMDLLVPAYQQGIAAVVVTAACNPACTAAYLVKPDHRLTQMLGVVLGT